MDGMCFMVYMQEPVDMLCMPHAGKGMFVK